MQLNNRGEGFFFSQLIQPPSFKGAKGSIKAAQKKRNPRKSLYSDSIQPDGKVYSVCLGGGLDLERLASNFQAHDQEENDQSPIKITSEFEEVCFAKAFGGKKDVFFFRFGCVVTWGLSEKEQEKIKTLLEPYVFQPAPPADIEEDEMYFTIAKEENAKPQLKRDVFLLVTSNTFERLAYSYSLAQSTKLAVFEDIVGSTIERTRRVPENLAKDGTTWMSRTHIAQQLGQLFIIRCNVNLQTDILDIPEILWEFDEWDVLYEKARDYLGVTDRADILNQRLDIIKDLYEILNDELEVQQSHREGLVVISLLSLELFVAILTELVDIKMLGRYLRNIAGPRLSPIRGALFSWMPPALGWFLLGGAVAAAAGPPLLRSARNVVTSMRESSEFADAVRVSKKKPSLFPTSFSSSSKTTSPLKEEEERPTNRGDSFLLSEGSEEKEGGVDRSTSGSRWGVRRRLQSAGRSLFEWIRPVDRTREEEEGEAMGGRASTSVSSAGGSGRGEVSASSSPSADEMESRRQARDRRGEQAAGLSIEPDDFYSSSAVRERGERVVVKGSEDPRESVLREAVENEFEGEGGRDFLHDDEENLDNLSELGDRRTLSNDVERDSEVAEEALRTSSPSSSSSSSYEESVREMQKAVELRQMADDAFMNAMRSAAAASSHHRPVPFRGPQSFFPPPAGALVPLEGPTPVLPGGSSEARVPSEDGSQVPPFPMMFPPWGFLNPYLMGGLNPYAQAASVGPGMAQFAPSTIQGQNTVVPGPGQFPFGGTSGGGPHVSPSSDERAREREALEQLLQSMTSAGGASADGLSAEVPEDPFLQFLVGGPPGLAVPSAAGAGGSPQEGGKGASQKERQQSHTAAEEVKVGGGKSPMEAAGDGRWLSPFGCPPLFPLPPPFLLGGGGQGGSLESLEVPPAPVGWPSQSLPSDAVASSRGTPASAVFGDLYRNGGGNLREREKEMQSESNMGSPFQVGGMSFDENFPFPSPSLPSWFTPSSAGVRWSSSSSSAAAEHPNSSSASVHGNGFLPLSAEEPPMPQSSEVQKRAEESREDKE
uniref:DUF155 domain-containing protein n=1 Tax=Chromera velia CCMP2878 TaxID=1169474 RepID=A0A0G4GIS2_9ALVE|eukprot:Cvel_22073.t1-p1 / transcript=Cvel_22073.t1 / gene=Cvel_22073 / organism=Chromera_velia_CCMP2878 / gene_product=Sporulation protein RMD1, putative / transcript_product=Sporulation protein RMD1, putative / location=Cvel_scaffold2133:5695-11822(+) / protein_length=1052 / sequence_SO=supercontig / SO=protein_coding / is_pseudo=false